MTAQFTCQLIAQPECQRVRLAIAIVLGLVDKREVQIIHFMNAYAFSGVQNAERQAVFGGLILINLKGDFSQLR